MAKRPYKKQAVQLRKSFQRAGFPIYWNEIDPSIELALEKLSAQKLEAGISIKPEGFWDPGFLGLTQDYVIFSKRGYWGMSPERFEIAPRFHFLDQTDNFNSRVFGASEITFSRHAGPLEYYNSSEELLAKYHRTGLRPNDPIPRTVPGRDGPAL